MSVTQHGAKLRAHALDVLCRARALPIGSCDRNDLRQLAIGLRWLERKEANVSRVRADAESRGCDSAQIGR